MLLSTRPINQTVRTADQWNIFSYILFENIIIDHVHLNLYFFSISSINQLKNIHFFINHPISVHDEQTNISKWQINVHIQ